MSACFDINMDAQKLRILARVVKLGAGDMFATLDDAPDSVLRSPERLCEFAFPQNGAVGFVLSGACDSQSEKGYWGREIRLETGETVQMRFRPRSAAAGKPLVAGETRLVAFRRCADAMPPIVGFAVLFLPRDAENLQDVRKSSYGHSLGCRALHVVLPALISKHDSNLPRPVQMLNVNPSGYHTIRSYVYSVSREVHVKTHGLVLKDTTDFTVAPGLGYLVAAGQMAGVDIPDPLQRSHVSASPGEFHGSIAALQRLLVKPLGGEAADRHSCSAFSILETLSAEGVLAMRAHPFFKGAKPKSMHAPLGVSLLIAVASRIAMFHSHFGLRAPTSGDAHANRQIGMAFNSRWTPIGHREFRAIDVMIHRSHDEALRRCKEEGGEHLRTLLDDNLTLLQRAGQRTNTRLVSEEPGDARRRGAQARETRFGRAERVEDCVSDAKYEYFQRQKVGQPLAEPELITLIPASRADMRVQLYGVQDEVELWLREGTYNGMRDEDANPCPRHGGECDCIADDAPAAATSEDQLNKAAMDSAVNATTALFIHGCSLFNQLGVNCFLVGPGCKAKCSDCSAFVEPLQAEILGSMAANCIFCNAKKCFSCARAALERGQPMMRCGACNGPTDVPRKGRKTSRKKGR